MSDWTRIIGAWPGDETDEEVEAFLNPPDAHEGMMTRREVIAELCETWAKADKMRDEGSGKFAHIPTFRAHGVLAVLKRGWGSATWNVRDLAHELALLMNAEREEVQGNE